MKRKFARLDDNQGQVVTWLRKFGAWVQSLAAVGDGCPDLLVIYRGRVYLLEVKDGAKRPSARRLTEAELAWHAGAREAGGEVLVVESVYGALLAIGASRQ